MARWRFKCWSCEHTAELVEKPVRSDTCSSCETDVYCCLNCRHYDRSASNECRETMADYVQKKDRANFCGYFTLREADDDASADEAAAARAKLDALFDKL